MKKMIWMVGVLFLAGLAFAQHAHDEGGCSCPTCKAKVDGTFTLPGLAGLNEPAHSEDHAGHNHGSESTCGGHGEEEGTLGVSPEMATKIGLKVKAAQGGVVSISVVFPAEIKLNRDQTAAVSPRYPSIVRQVFAEIGDTVRKGDVLASLENRQTMAVYSVHAPRDGIIISKKGSVGETASEERVLYEVANLSSVWVDISIFPKYQHLIRKGMGVELVAHDGHTARGTVQYISPLISHETRTFTARCVLEGADEDFTPGAFVRAKISTESKSVPVRVEREAVQRVEGTDLVFVADEHGFESRDVVVGLSSENFVEITAGLHPGERYVSAGAFALKAQILTQGMDPHAGHGH